VKRSGGRNKDIHEIGAILAEGYLRLLAQKSTQIKDSDVTAYLSENSALNPLDNSGDQWDVSKTNTPATGHTERGCHV